MLWLCEPVDWGGLMPYDVWVDENGLYPPACQCGHPWMGHADNLAHTCMTCPCQGYSRGTDD